MLKIYLELAVSCARQITEREVLPDDYSLDLAIDFMFRDEIFMEQLEGVTKRQALLFLLSMHSQGRIILGTSVKKEVAWYCTESAILGDLGPWAADAIL